MNNNDSNKTLIIVILAVIAGCGCLAASCCAAAFYALSHLDKEMVSDILSGDTEKNVSDILKPENEDPVITDTGNDTEIVTEAEDLGLTAEELQIIKITEETRGITAEEKMAPVYKTVDELRQFMTDELNEATDEDLANELGLYTILAFAPKDFDLKQFYVDLYTEQIAGYYDPEENKMFLIEDNSPYENALTLSHEYTHYLQYNNPEFDETLNYDDDFCEENGETCIIITAITEGDASLVENLIDVEDTILKGHETGSDDTSSDSDIFDRAPKYFQDSLLFPYVYGFDFVTYHYLKGGFDAVDKLYTELPQSIEQIMHPEKYLNDIPVEVTTEPFRNLITKDFEVIQESVLNESDVIMILSSAYEPGWQLSERQAAAGADGWGGGSYIFARNEDKPLFFAKIVWDSADEAKEAEQTFEMYCDKRFGKQTDDNAWSDPEYGSVYLIRQNDVLFWMILPDNFDSETLTGLILNGSSL